MPITGRRMLPLVIAAAVLATVAPVRARTTPIHPGGRISAPHACSIGFILTDGEHLYASTAGHCVGAVDTAVANPSTGPFGSVAFRRDAADDIAFVRIDQDMNHQVDAAVEGWGAPTGVASPLTTARGDRVGFAGQGTIVGELDQTRARPGLLVHQDEHGFSAGAPAIFGDSGAPVIHVASGRAIGVVEGLGATIPPSTVVGTTIERGIALAAGAGLTLSLVTV